MASVITNVKPGKGDTIVLEFEGSGWVTYRIHDSALISMINTALELAKRR